MPPLTTIPDSEMPPAATDGISDFFAAHAKKGIDYVDLHHDSSDFKAAL